MVPAVARDGIEGLALLNAAQEQGHAVSRRAYSITTCRDDRARSGAGNARSTALALTSIVVLSSAGLEWDAIRARELGIAASLTKPVRRSVLLKAILAAVGQTMNAVQGAPEDAG
jgi:CheY-like chemotaxis protein